MQALTGTDTAVTSVADTALTPAMEVDLPGPGPAYAATAVPAIDVLPALTRGGPSARDLVLPLVLLLEFLAGLVAGIVF